MRERSNCKLCSLNLRRKREAVAGRQQIVCVVLANPIGVYRIFTASLLLFPHTKCSAKTLAVQSFPRPKLI